MVLGITGISGAGKHTAGEFFSQKGWVILDADKIAHYLYRPYTHIWKAIVDYFGENILTGNDLIDRQKLGRIVFDEKDPEANEKLRALNALVHPAISQYLKEQIHRHFSRKNNIAILAALWKEIRLDSLCDKILLIQADIDTAFRRIQARDGILKKIYRMRIRSQSPPKKPDFTVKNNATIKEFYQQLQKIGF